MTPSLLVEFVLTGPGLGRGEAALFILSIPSGEPNQTVHGGAFAASPDLPSIHSRRQRVSDPRRFIRKGDILAGQVDKAKGRVKKAVGELTDNEDLKREGEIDEASGKVKDVTKKVADKAREVVRKK